MYARMGRVFGELPTFKSCRVWVVWPLTGPLYPRVFVAEGHVASIQVSVDSRSLNEPRQPIINDGDPGTERGDTRTANKRRKRDT